VTHPCQEAYSLSKYLSTDVARHCSFEQKDELEVALSRAVVQGIRLAASANDYRLIVRLVDASVRFANSTGLVQPRIFGEAIDGLSRTTASVGKIKKMWSLLLVSPNRENFTTSASESQKLPAYLTSRHGAAEVNAMIRALVRRGRIGSAMEVFRSQIASCQHRRSSTLRTTDSHSLWILLDALAASVDNSDDASLSTAAKSVEAQPSNLCLKRFRSLAISPCWQWNEAASILDVMATASSGLPPKDGTLYYMNNHVWSALLQLNIRAGEAFLGHDVAQMTLQILEWMEEFDGICLDSVTCTLLLSGLRSDWESAVTLFRRMQERQLPHPKSSASNTIVFAKPNPHAYSAVLAACGRARQHETAIILLNEFERDDEGSSTSRSTLVYNSFLLSLFPLSRRLNFHKNRSLHRFRPTQRACRESRHRVQLALEILNRMERRADVKTRPDTVTFNTFLAILAGAAPVLQDPDWNSLRGQASETFGSKITTRFDAWFEELPHAVVRRMIEQQLPRDDKTYRHALSACTTLRGLHHLLKIAFSDSETTLSPDTFCSALPVSSYLGGFEGLQQVLKKLPSTIVRWSALQPLIHSFGICQRTDLIPLLIQVASNEEQAADSEYLEKELGINVVAADGTPALDIKRHLEAAVEVCLRANDFPSAGLVIGQMRKSSGSYRISPKVFQEVARTYALQVLGKSQRSHGDAGRDNARKAYTVLESLSNPPMALMALVAKSLAKAGLFDSAADVLRSVHLRLSREEGVRAPKSTLSSSNAQQADARLVQQLHRSLLSSCADHGNVTAALRFCDCIQKWGPESLRSNARDELLPRMHASEWRLILVAALKSGNWRVCLSTLQFLQPSVEALRPGVVLGANNSAARLSNDRRRRRNQEYEELSSAFNLAVKCLAKENQYGWIIRVLDDWIAWSGRRPPKQSVFLSVRALCARGRGTEVGSLVARCLAPDPVDELREGTPYEIGVTAFAITCLYNEGLYDAADDVYISAVRSSMLPLNLHEGGAPGVDGSRTFTLDLHGMNLAVAHSAVRIALQRVARDTVARGGSEPAVAATIRPSDLIVVTGRGRSSALRMRPVLRPEVQRMLVEEFYPPLGSSSVPGNLGALRVNADDIRVWLDKQQVAKRSRVLAVAALLKRISADAIRAAVTVSVSASSRPTNHSLVQAREI
jgi:pentatricopeptide repeat protein